MSDDRIFLKALSIQNYKGFYDKQTLNFSFPDLKGSSGLNIIVGPNNSGKSTIIDIIKKLNSKATIPTSERHHGKKVFFEFVDSENDKIEIYNDSSRIIHNDSSSRLYNHKISIISSWRYWDIEITHPRENYVNYDVQRQNIPTGEIDKIFSRQLYDLKDIRAEKFKKICDNINEMLVKIYPNFGNWDIEQIEHKENKYIQYITKNSELHRFDNLGSGIQLVLPIVLSFILHDSYNPINTIIIDEPELSLHPQVQKRLAKIIYEYSSKLQIILCTHSPYFINIDNILQGVKIIRLSKPNDEKCIVNEIKDLSLYVEKILTKYNYQTPQLMDAVAKEIFFSERILFLEGQEDVGILSKYSKDNKFNINFDFFGYGAGGFGNIKHLVDMSIDLGVKCAVLIDNDNGEDEVNTLKEKCDKNNIKLEILTTHDIRDKYKINDKGEEVLHKEGIFDKKGKIKPKYKHDIDSIINKLIDYFNN